MTEPVRAVRIRIVADPGLLGWDEARAIAFTIAGFLGCHLGYAVSRLLGVAS